MNQTEFVRENMALQGECGFMAGNLSAKSIFGKYALAWPGEDHGQVSLSVTGHIRWVIFGLCEHLFYNFLFQNQSQVTEYGWDGPELIQRNNVPAWKVKMVIL